MDRDRDAQSSSSVGAADGFGYFSSAANSMRGSTPSNLSDGKMSSTGLKEKCLAVTLMFSNYKNGNNVLFLEAGKDFVDILFSFLTLPMGSIIKLLAYGGSDGSNNVSLTAAGLMDEEAIFKIYNSVSRMEDEKFYTSKKALLDPQEASLLRFGGNLQQADHPGRQEQDRGPSSRASPSSDCFYSCGMVPHCVCITKKVGRRCPRHGRKMQTRCQFVKKRGGESGARGGPVEGEGGNQDGYVKDVGRFFVTDNLEIYPASKSLALLQKLKVERTGLLSGLDLFVGTDEILKLLKASLVSSNVLQDVFGRLLRQRLPPPPTPPPSTPSTLVSTPVLSLMSTTTNSFDDVAAFAQNRTRPKYDDYFPRPKSLMFF